MWQDLDAFPAPFVVFIQVTCKLFAFDL